VVTHGLRGMVGGMLVFKQVNGKTVVAQRPRKSSKPPTEDQLERQQKFREAAIYAKNAIKEPQLKEIYDAFAGKGKSAYNIAFADYYKAPILSKAMVSNYNGTVGATVKVQAIDDVQVQMVTVEIKRANGLLIESGEAQIMVNGLDWEYVATVANLNLTDTMISFTATDIPGNSSTLEIALT
jgi:hypothetical protein